MTRNYKRTLNVLTNIRIDFCFPKNTLFKESVLIKKWQF